MTLFHTGDYEVVAVVVVFRISDIVQRSSGSDYDDWAGMVGFEEGPRNVVLEFSQVNLVV